MNTEYIYKYNSEKQDAELAKYEMQAIFEQDITSESFLSEFYVNPNKSYFINYQIEIMFNSTSLDELVKMIDDANLDYDQYKIEFINVKSNELPYKERLQYCIKIAHSIEGEGTVHNPLITLVVTKLENKWYFGKLNRNDRAFEDHQDKPHSYSNAMTTQISRALINIACGKRNDLRLLDPCCGIGTVVIEALSQNYDITGRELNSLVAEKAQQNLLALGFENVIKCQDMHTITEKYDVAIMDLPYGIMSVTNVELQTGLVTKAYNLADRLLLVANEPSEHLIADTKWNIKDIISIPKATGYFKRYIYVLNK